MPARLDWTRDGADWPNRDASRFVSAGGLTWHVQVAGQGPVLLLVHGTGASTHSWRDLLPLLATGHTVVAPDLPGHGFTSLAQGEAMSLPGMSALLAALLDTLGMAPTSAVGHSAGAAIVVRMTLDRRLAARAVVSVNGAFLPFAGLLRVFSPAAKLLATTSVAARLAAARAGDPAAVRRLLASTGSRLDDRGTELYARLMRSPGHVAGALAMMARWNLDALPAALPGLQVPVLLVVGERDGTIAPAQSTRVAALLPNARVERLPALGHLAHEEAPARVGALVGSFLARASVAD
ncbi:MAG TPA: alpha/beta fold hydrolase BchO [Caldimonas sp.]|nr:alpha/beta fold hydrolase BchO [Caldimonas sp.]